MILALLLVHGAAALLLDPSVDCFVTTFVGQGSAGSQDGVGSNARFHSPRCIAADPAGNAYVADRSSNKIRGVSPNGTVSTMGGNGTTTAFANGALGSSTFFNPIGIAASRAFVYTADFAFNRVRATSISTLVTSSLVGTGLSAIVDGVGDVSAATKAPTGVALSLNASQLFLTDNVNAAALLRVVNLASGRVVTLGRGLTLTNGGGGCSGGIAQLRNLSVLVADTANHRIAMLLANGSFVTYAGVLGVPGHGDGPANNVTFSFPTDVKLDADGSSLLVVDSGNNTLRRLLADGSAVTLAGGNAAGFVDIAFGGAAAFNSPCGVAVANASEGYLVTDSGNHRVRRVRCSGRVTFNVSTIAGGGGNGLTPGAADGAGTAALFQDAAAIALSAAEDFALVADMSNSKLRRVSLPCGKVTTLAGGGGSGAAAGSVNGVGSAALFYQPRGLAAAAGGGFFASDTLNARIRFVSALGVVSTAAGNGSLGRSDGAVASGATTLSSPRGLAFDAATGALFIADMGNNKVRVLWQNASLGSLLGGGLSGVAAGSADGVGTSALFNTPVSLAVWRGGAPAAAPLL